MEPMGDADMSRGKRAVKQAYKDMTGKELARLVLEHYVETDHNRPGLLSDADIQAIHNALSGRRMDILQFNAWLETYSLVYMTQLDGRINSLEASRWLFMAASYLEKFWLEDALRTMTLSSPAIVTAKQLQDLREQQRQDLLADIVTLHEVLSRRVYHVGMAALSQERQEALQKELDEEASDLDENLHEEWLWTQEVLPEVWETALSSLLELAQQGRLQAVRMTEAALEEIEAARPPSVASSVGLMATRTCRAAEERLTETERRLFSELRAAHSEQDQQALIRVLETLRAGSLDTYEAIDELIGPFRFSTQTLYELGLPEWLEWVDEFKPDMTELGTSKVAVLQEHNLWPDELDERGHYKKPKPLMEVVNLLRLEKKDQRFEKHGGLLSMCRKAVSMASSKIESLLSMQAVLEILSEIIGVDLTEDFDELVSEIQSDANYYNALVDLLLASPESREKELQQRRARYGELHTQHRHSRLPNNEDLPRLDFEKLKPSEEWLNYYAERMAINLGPDWYKHVREETDLFKLAISTMVETSQATGKQPTALEKAQQEVSGEST